MNKCLKCNKKHDGSFGSGKYCSLQCANSRGPRTDDFKKVVSKKLTGVLPWNTGKKLDKEHRENISKGLTGKTRYYPEYSDEKVFVENSSYQRYGIKKRILKKNLLEYKCVCCGNVGTHNGQELVLQLDHINGVNNDHRLENLRFLCPNCHTQQDTYAAKNKTKKKNITV
jgi:5-methylcytosine-specific restriction endonuclease McrA